METSAKNQYLVCLPDVSEPLPLAEAAVSRPYALDYNLPYFQRIFERMEAELGAAGLTCYLTRNVSELPSYGPDVVAVLLGDEWCRAPLYADRIRAVFKCYGNSPAFGVYLSDGVSWLDCMTVIQHFRILLKRTPGLLRLWRARLKGMDLEKRMFEIPLGYYRQAELPVKPMKERACDVFFAGSIVDNRTTYPVWSIRHWLETPKNISRRLMVEELTGIRQRNQCSIVLKLTGGFPHENKDTAEAAADSYSHQMMDMRVCVAPRGTSFETFRFFEGLRYGCVVITEALPSRWFYDGAPVIRIKRWHELEPVLNSLLTDPKRVHELHQASLRWWDERCSESAVGRYMAERLISLANKDGLRSRIEPSRATLLKSANRGDLTTGGL